MLCRLQLMQAKRSPPQACHHLPAKIHLPLISDRAASHALALSASCARASPVKKHCSKKLCGYLQPGPGQGWQQGEQGMGHGSGAAKSSSNGPCFGEHPGHLLESEGHSSHGPPGAQPTEQGFACRTRPLLRHCQPNTQKNIQQKKSSRHNKKTSCYLQAISVTRKLAYVSINSSNRLSRRNERKPTRNYVHGLVCRQNTLPTLL